jgi:hypothetical protein
MKGVFMAELRQKIALLAGVLFMTMACNLSTDSAASQLATYTPIPVDLPVSGALITPVPTQAIVPPTLTSLPLPGMPVTAIPVTSVPVGGVECEVYTTFSGSDPRNVLSLRQSPDAGSYQLYKVPTGVQVLLVPGSQEVEAGGYHWLNVIYELSTQMRYQGWIARDSYIVGGVRNPTVATLIPAGRQAAC